MRTLGIIPAAGDKNPLDSARIKAYLRLIPVLFVCYIIAYVDRTNVGIAKLTMQEDMPAFGESVIGFGAGIFFLGYFLLEVPGSVIVERWSARKWICRIMVTWGIMAALTAFVKTPMQFYIVRFLLGVAEAGFFPGIIVYLSHWFPQKDRARAISYFLVASPIAMIIGPAVSQLFLDIGRPYKVPVGSITAIGAIGGFEGNGASVIFGSIEAFVRASVEYNPEVLGLEGWQWIYIFWGIPAVLVGIAVLYLLPDKPSHAGWLSADEQSALEQEIAAERAAFGAAHHHSLLSGLTNPRVWLLSIVYFGIVTANYGLEFFLPSILKEWYSMEPTRVAWLVMIPSLLVIVGQLGIGWSSDHFQERRWHSVLPVALGAICIALTAVCPRYLWLTLILFTIGAAGMKSYMPAFWSLPSYILTATAAAGSVGLINSIGNLGGFLGPTVIGWVKENIGSYEYGLCFLACTSLISASLIAVMPLRKKA